MTLNKFELKSQNYDIAEQIENSFINKFFFKGRIFIKREKYNLL